MFGTKNRVWAAVVKALAAGAVLFSTSASLGGGLRAVPVDDGIGVGLRGDFNRDCVVDNKDLQMLLESFGSEIGDPNYDPRVDRFNRNGVIDNFELQLLLDNWGASCES